MSVEEEEENHDLDGMEELDPSYIDECDRNVLG